MLSVIGFHHAISQFSLRHQSNTLDLHVGVVWKRLDGHTSVLMLALPLASLKRLYTHVLEGLISPQYCS